MIDYKTASKDQLKSEMKRLASIVSDTPFGTKKNSFTYQRFLMLAKLRWRLLVVKWTAILG